MRKKQIIRSTADIPVDPERPDTLLIYHSSRGSSRQYAEWLTEALDCDVVPYSRQYLGYSILYRNVIFLSWVRASQITCLRLLRLCADRFLLPAKNVILAAVGVMDPTPRYLEHLRQRNMEPEFAYPSLFLLPGRCDPSKGRFLRWMYGRSLYDGLAPDEAEVLKGRLAKGWDGLDRSHLAPVIQAVLRTRQQDVPETYERMRQDD